MREPYLGGPHKVERGEELELKDIHRETNLRFLDIWKFHLPSSFPSVYFLSSVDMATDYIGNIDMILFRLLNTKHDLMSTQSRKIAYSLECTSCLNV